MFVNFGMLEVGYGGIVFLDFINWLVLEFQDVWVSRSIGKDRADFAARSTIDFNVLALNR